MSGAYSPEPYVGISTFYTVTIAAPASSSPPSDGFVDPNRIESYLTNTVNPPSNVTLAASEAKRRANLRYSFIIASMGLMANCYVLNVAAPGADAATAPTSVVMTIQVERGDGALVTMDEENPTVWLTGTAALARCIARGLMENQTLQTDVFDPTQTTSTGTHGATTSVVRFGKRIMPLAIGPLAASLDAAQASVTIVAALPPAY